MSERSRNIAMGTTAAVVAGALAASIANREQGSDSDPGTPVDSPEAKVSYVLPERKAPAYTNTGMTKDGKIMSFKEPRPTVEIHETKDGDLRATKNGNPISFNLHLPAKGTQEKGSPQQDADPNTSVSYSPPESQVFMNSGTDSKGNTFQFADVNSRPIKIEEDGNGGLTAENQMTGDPVSINVHLPTDGTEQPDMPIPENQKQIQIVPQK